MKFVGHGGGGGIQKEGRLKGDEKGRESSERHATRKRPSGVCYYACQFQTIKLCHLGLFLYIPRFLCRKRCITIGLRGNSRAYTTFLELGDAYFSCS